MAEVADTEEKTEGKKETEREGREWWEERVGRVD